MLVDQSDLGDARSSALSLSTARPSAGRPREVVVVACSCSIAACAVLASGVLAPPVSLSLSVSCALLFTLVTGPPMPALAPRTSFAYLLWVSSVSIDSSCSSVLPSLHILLPRLSRGSPQNSAYLPLPPVSPALPHLSCVGSFSPALRSEFAPTSAPLSSHVQLPGPSTRPLGISLPDALDALKVSLPPEQLDLLCSSFVAAVAPVSRSSLARLRGELRRIGASATSILPPGAARATRRASLHVPSFGFLPAAGAAGSILLVWSPPLTGDIVHVGRYSISASLSGLWPNGPVLVTAVYGPCVGALRGQLWAELHQVHQLAASPWLLAGDFNCLLSPTDSSSPVTSGPSMSAFRSFVDEFGLFDVPATNGTFTWSNNRNPPILRRLDRIFLSPKLFSAFPSSSLVLGPRHLSDHAPLLFSLLRGRLGIGHARFRFELWWLRDDSFVATVPNWWARAVDGRWAAFKLSRKLHLIRREAIAWKRFFWSGKFLEVAEWDEEILSLQASDNISAVQSSRLLCLQCLTQEWRIRESIHWQQRSKLGWLAHGDQNSRFLHLVASQRRRQTLLQSMNIGGRIKNAVWALSSGKAPDIDGFPVEYFRTFWEVCSADVFVFCDEFASNSVFLKEFNQATCVLVPKHLNPTDVTHFRPISILGTPYKIIAKLLSLRLAPIMPCIINPFQVAFVKGQRLQDTVVLANEVVHSLYCLRLHSFILKLDISKAFDSVSWEFLSNLLTRFAFGPSIRQWIMSLVTGAQLAVSFNGKCGDFFSLERGLRQGCPLSPLLFNLVAESFSALFHHATVVGFLAPHSLPHLQTFSTIQYADDFLLFGCASRQQIVRTWLILRVFELISGLSINSAKCHLSLIHADPTTVLLTEACFGCRITLAKHCLASVPLHALVVFRPPVAVLRRFDKLIRKFIWNGNRPSDRLAHWDVVAFLRLLGGAGVTNLSRASESSLCSWWWRLATEQSPITQFISSKFDLPSPSVWNTSISHTSPSHFWCDMLSVLPLFLRLADISSSTSPSWPLSPTREFTFSSCYLASFGPSVALFPPRSLWSLGPSPRAVAFVWLLLTGHINTFDHLQRLGISLANQCPLCLVATESRVHLFTSCPFFSSVLAYVWPSLVSSLPNPPSIHLLFLFCPSPHLTASWGHVWRPWLISAWWRIWEERNNRVFRDTFSSPDYVARIVQGDVQFAIRLKRRCQSAAR
ncbi:Transposon TX1 uncharacterized protein [Nymphaea thermarum]|nr:Transposon TX1 uncharacterized protein [Nymphaea thermarum]